jgi:hypothetical protein
MPYLLQPGSSAALAEQEYATGQVIQFTGFDSCIGVVARTGQSLLGIHLVMFQQNGSVFSVADAIDIRNRVATSAPQAQEIVICGVFTAWSQNIGAAFQELIAQLQALVVAPVRVDPDQNAGHYTASVVNGQIGIHYH